MSFSSKRAIHHREMDRYRTFEDCERSLRPIAALASDHVDGEQIPSHHHPRAQLIHAVSGVMTIVSRAGNWIVPTGRAVWMPAGQGHAIRIAGNVGMRTVFVHPDVRPTLPTQCEVIEVSTFLREAIVVATAIPLNYDLGGRDERVMDLILDEVERAPRLKLHVTIPNDPRLARLCERLIEDPSSPVTLESLATQIHVSGRTLARMFHRELGMSFGEWLRRSRLLLALPRLAAGASVLEVALEHGYESPSAFSAMFKRTVGFSPTGYLRAGAISTAAADTSDTGPAGD